ncbi:hypothetical protein [Actinomadura sp. NEAU-AAG7]|uniref:hypothetical protein n=1 Tax=Actinomadura sp. NEAU-AAG7 TaxID=2839640 RepID=UPI001BE4C562|nr:hypothetical protein [Actinomadura sp. NEAU-AAG7]MBT2212306.1 hypothetical protein [Actinomadura sp. NEAU-AAG7]
MTAVREAGPGERGAPPRRAPSGFTVTVATAAALLLLFFTVPNVKLVWRAARGDGAPGAFTAARVSCVSHPGHEACSWYGTFTPAGGGGARETTMYGAGRGDLAAGERVPAIDVGRASRVYAPSGSHEWIPTGLILLAGAALLYPLARRVSGRARRAGAPARSGIPAG